MRRGRHSADKDWSWDSEPARSDQTREAVQAEELDPAKRAPGRKDRKHWCKSARGPHTPVVELMQIGNRVPVCRWIVTWSRADQAFQPVWSCAHQQVCSSCGRWFRYLVGDQCPDYRTPTDVERRVLAVDVARLQVRRDAQVRRRPEIRGPQGYRRRRKTDG